MLYRLYSTKPLSAIVPISNYANHPLCLSVIIPISHHTYWPSYLTTIMPIMPIMLISHHAQCPSPSCQTANPPSAYQNHNYWPSHISAIMPICLSCAYYPSDLFLQLLILLACFVSPVVF